MLIGNLQSILPTTYRYSDNDETLTLIICLCNSKTKKPGKLALSPRAVQSMFYSYRYLFGYKPSLAI